MFEKVLVSEIEFESMIKGFEWQPCFGPISSESVHADVLGHYQNVSNPDDVYTLLQTKHTGNLNLGKYNGFGKLVTLYEKQSN